MKPNKFMACALAGAGLVGMALASTPAFAEPVGAPAFRALSGVGSDTTENVIQGMSDAITIGGVKQIGSYNANGGGNITTKDPAVTPGCTIARPNGSGAGRTALLTSLQANSNAGNGCLDFARSSSARGTFTSVPSMTWVPFARENVSFAVRSDSDIPRDLTLADMTSIFKCQTGFWPVLPQTGSGTRAYWLTVLGVTEAQITDGTYACLSPSVNNGAPANGQAGALSTGRPLQQENAGVTLKADEIMPFSVSQYASQAAGVITDVRGKTVLGAVAGVTAQGSNTGFSINREVYNIIPTAKTGTAPWSTVFVGGSSLICTNTSVLAKYGFSTVANCGDTSSVS